MSENVARLKELLFGNEAQALVDLERRIDEVARTDTRARDEIKKEISGAIERAGTTERFTQNVSEVLDEALRRAEVAKHTELSNSIAPVVVTTIKAELKNSQDEMVEALYPITGRLVKAYVASAIKDLTEDMNRRLEKNPVMLRLQSLTTGRSVAELALAGTQEFEVEELYLIRRGSGELVAHWPPLAEDGREQMVSGVLAAINAVANEAFAADEASLRQIDLDQSTVYLRASPLYLLAAKCSGMAPKGIEQTLDDTFLNAIEKQHGADSLAPGEASQWHARLLEDLGDELKPRIEAQKADLAGPAGNPLKMLAAIVLVPLLLLLGWWWATDFMNERTRSTAERVVASTAAMQGYPATFQATNFGRNLKVSGLVPSVSVKDKVLSRLTLVLPKTFIQDEFSVVPGSDINIPDHTPAINELKKSVRDVELSAALAEVRRAGERSARRLAEAADDLHRAASATANQSRAAALAKRTAGVGVLAKQAAQSAMQVAALKDGEPASLDTVNKSFSGLSPKIDEEVSALLAVLGGDVSLEKKRNGSDAQLRESASYLAVETAAEKAERLAAIAAVAALTARLEPTPPPPPPPAVLPPEPSPRELLRELVLRSAVFFSNGLDYRDAAATARTLDALAPRLKAAQVLVRVVGYTDEAGNAAGNTTLAAERAEKVRQDLVARGASATLLTAVGRAESKDLSMSQGPESPNRRVEFEIGLDGEVPP